MKILREDINDFNWADEIQGDDFHIGTRFRHRGEKYDYHSWNVWEITSIDPDGYVGVKQVIKEGYPVEDNHDTRNIPYVRFKEAYDSGSFENESVRNDIDMMIYPGAKFIIEEAWWEGEKDGIRHPREEGKIVLEITEVNEWGDSKYKVIESDLHIGEPVGTEDEAEIDTIRNFIADGWWKPYGGSLTENFDWVKQVPDIQFGDEFDEDDLDERIFFEDNFTKVRYELDFEDFNNLVNDGYEDWYFRDIVLYNGTYEDEGDDGWFDDEEVNYLPNYLSQDQKSRLMEVLKRSAKLFDLKGQTVDGPLQTIIDDNFWDAEPYIGKNLYRGRDDWETLTGNYMYYISKYVNINRWKSLNNHYLSELKSNNLEVDGSASHETVSITVPFPYKTVKWEWRWNDEFGRRDNFPVEGDSITNLTEILTKGVDSILNKGWSDYWYEDFDTDGVAEELRPDFDRFIENIEKALDESTEDV
jgi:hypothetical protein